jgi:hypothetical protein
MVGCSMGDPQMRRPARMYSADYGVRSEREHSRDRYVAGVPVGTAARLLAGTAAVPPKRVLRARA